MIDSRLVNERDQVRRRRECSACKERFTTYEKIEISMPRVIKSNAERQPFDEAKLRAGILRALEKRKVSSNRVEAAITRIKRALLASGDREVHSHDIGERVMRELRNLDEVAYVRFASVYRKFQDVSEFLEEVRRIEREPSAEQREQQLPLLPNDD